MTTLALTGTTANSATFTVGDMGADGTIDVQVATRPDFQFCVCPITSFPRATPMTVQGAQQRGSFFARARNRSAAGVVGDWSPTEPFRTPDGTAQVTTPGAIMIEPAIIVKPEHIIQLVDGGGGTVAGYPLDNLLIDSPVAWRSVVAGTANSIVFRHAGAPIDTIAFLQTNLVDTTTWSVAAGATQAAATGGAPAYSTAATAFQASTNLPARPGYHGIIRLPAPQAYPWWKISWTAPNQPQNLTQVDHLIVGLNRTSKNYTLDKTESPAPLTTVDRLRSGVVDRVKGKPMRKVEFDLSLLSEAVFETLYGDLWRHENDSMLIVPNSRPGAFLHDRILFGDLSGGRIVNPSSPRFTRTFAINSLI